MSVIVIGDRAVGKTSMVYALTDPREQERVSVEQGPDYTAGVAPTDQLNPGTLTMVVDLPVPRQIQVQWFDTPGEAFTNRQWRKEKSVAWDAIKQKMSQSRYIVLLLPPDRNSVNPQRLDDSKETLDDFQTPEIWERRVIEWLNFIDQECSAAKHILICLNKADLLCDIEVERQKWLYKTSGFSWADYSDHVLKCYFKGVEEKAKQYISKKRSRLITFFITTNKNRTLLELPWLYIGSFETSKVS
ncbi:GTPase domain-containing protein [Microcoleus sp. F8_C2]